MSVQSQTLKNATTCVQVYCDDPIVEENSLEFRLLYWGRVLSSGNTKRRSKEKHAMRRQFRPQLKRLWKTDKNLLDLSRVKGWSGEVISEDGETVAPSLGSWENFGIDKMANERPFNKFRFVPLVLEDACLRCNIEILFLRHEDTGNLIFQGGDIDGRIKTIFDAMRIPRIGELAADDSPQEGEDPFFVLLEDDKLISQVSVATDRLLLLPGETSIDPNDAFLQIKVELNITTIPNKYGYYTFGGH